MIARQGPLVPSSAIQAGCGPELPVDVMREGRPTVKGDARAAVGNNWAHVFATVSSAQG